MRISVILGDDLGRLGFYLEEEEDLIYLKCRGERVAVFRSWTATVKEIKQAAQAWLEEHKKGGEI